MNARNDTLPVVYADCLPRVYTVVPTIWLPAVYRDSLSVVYKYYLPAVFKYFLQDVYTDILSVVDTDSNNRLLIGRLYRFLTSDL